MLDVIRESSEQWEGTRRLGFDARALAARGDVIRVDMLGGRNRFVSCHESEMIDALDAFGESALV